MDLEILLGQKRFLDELSVSIRNIILASFPNLTSQEKEEVDLEVKLKLWKNAARGKKIENLRSYLWRVVYTTALDVIAERKCYLPIDEALDQVHGEGNVPDSLMAPDHAGGASDYRLRLYEAVSALPERRQAVAKRYLAGEGIAAIAASLGWRENQVRHLLYRGLADVRKLLAPGPAVRPSSRAEGDGAPGNAFKRGKP
jgi:DNA-directed RNA polymerase specialized sigma24 family protein